MRGELRVGLGEVEVVGELRALFLLARADLGDQVALTPHLLAQFADQIGVLGEALDEDRAGAVERRLRVRDALVRVDEHRGRRLRVGRRVVEQAVGQRLEPRFARDHGLRAALRLVREVDVLEPRLRVRGEDRGLEGVVQLALAPDGLEHGEPPLVEFAQVAQPLFERAQLRVVEHAGHLLAVPRDERDGRTAVEQLDGGLDLSFAHAQFFGDLLLDRHAHCYTLLLRLASDRLILPFPPPRLSDGAP